MSYDKAAQLVSLALRAAGRVGISLDDIAEEARCSIRTAKRIRSKLEEIFPTLNFMEDDNRKRRWRLPATNIMPFIRPTSEEMAALDQAIAILKKRRLNTEVIRLETLKDKVEASVPSKERTKLGVDSEALLLAQGFAARPGPRGLSDMQVDDDIAHAIKGCQRIDIEYLGHTDAMPRWRTIEPHGILLGTRRYLVAIDATKPDSGFRHYRIEAITDTRLQDGCFEIRSDFDIQSYAKRGFDSYINESQYSDIVWRFSSIVADRVRRFEFHPDQKFVENADGSLTVSFKASGLLEMCWHLYSWGNNVEVLAPAELRNMISGHQRTDFPGLP